jgi:ATP-binding protein involved in chromosome partitioning
MTNDIAKSVYTIVAKYIDPQTKIPLNKDNPDINTNIKDGHVNVTINIDPIFKDNYNQLITEMKNDLKKIKNVHSANVILTSVKMQSKETQNKHKWKINAKNIIAIASGKGGVGKSTFSTNFAIALKQLNNKVGILDADIYGPSIPRMMGISGKPQANENKKLIPLENYGIKCMSIGFLIDVDTPAIWRGPMVMKALEQMYNGVEWGELDYLIVDLPPGTGDAQLSLAQSSKLSGSIIVSTPQDVALIDARKGINMFKKVNVPILGIVENMSYFICDSCNKRHEIFSYGGVKKEAEKFNISFLGELPLDKKLREQSDQGQPACIDNPNGEIAKIYLSIAQSVMKQ